MKKYILLAVVFIFSIVVLTNSNYETYAYKDSTSFQDYIDFDVSNLNDSPFVYKMPSFWSGSKSLYISINWYRKNLTISLNELTTLYEQDVIIDSHTFITPGYFYEYSGINYDLTDLNSGSDMTLEISNIELVYFDESYYDNPSPSIYIFSDVTDSTVPAGLNTQFSYFQYQFDMYNYLNDIFDVYAVGFNDAKGEYGWYDGNNWITATVHGSNRYNAGLNENKTYYGILYEDTWLTAEQYGAIRYGIGYDKGLTTEIDWFEWSMTFFLMPFRILNIQVLPGIRIGYFALFSLLLGVVGWFFFIVGKGGGRKK